MIITETKSGFEVAFKYDAIKVAAVKRISGSYFLPARKVWVVNKGHRNDLMRLVARFSKPSPDGNYSSVPAQVELLERETVRIDKTLPKLTINIPLKMELREYQKDGVAYCIEKKSCLIGDQQGLGKTATAIAATIAQNSFPCLVICKSSLMRNWEKEWKQWTDKTPVIMKDSISKSWPVFFQTGYVQVAICSYESLNKYFVQNLNRPKEGKWMVKDIAFRETTTMFKSIIIDESHLIKNPESLRTKLVVGLTKKRENIYLLSGTPVLNDPIELFPQLAALGKTHLFGTINHFKTLYGKNSPRKREALPMLNYLLHKHCYFRRIKSEVATEIPPKTREVVLIDIDNRQEYDKAERDFKKFLEDKLEFTAGQIDKKLRAEALVKIMELKKIAARGKLHAVYEWIDDLVAEDEKFVLFGFHKEITEQLAKHCSGTVRLCASADPDTLQRRKEKFQSDPDIKGIVCSIMADAEGHTLTAASNVGIVELPWHFGKAEQMEDRLHRIGTIYPVTASYFIGDNTIDRKIYDLIMEKKEMHDMITGTDEEVEERVVDKLINLFNQQ